MIRRGGRWPLIVVATLALMAVAATPAFAEPIGDAVEGVLFGQANPMLSFIQLKDSHGLSVWQYELSIDRGNPILSTDKWYWSKPVDAAWQFYRDGVLTAIWVLDWILDFGWVATVGEAVIPIGDGLHTTVSQLGLAGLFLTIAGVVGAIYVARGKAATGVWEIAAAVVIMAAVSTFLANPVRLILDPSDGLVFQVRDTSMAFVAAVSDQPGLQGTGQTNAITASLIETFIRQPLQMANFGMVIDGTSCEGTYDEVVKAGPYAWESDIRDRMNDCASELGDWAGNPSPSMLGTVVFLYPAVLIIMVLALAIGGGVLMAGIRACYQAAKASVTVVVGILPGAARRPFLGTIADLLVALGVFVFSHVFLAIFLQAIQLILTSEGPMSAPQRLFVIDLFLVAGIFVYLTNKKRILQSSQRLKELLASRPGSPAGHAQPPPRLNTASVVSAAADVARLARAFARRGRGGPARPAIPNRMAAGTAGGGPVWTQVPGPGGPAGGGRGGGPGLPGPGRGGGGGVIPAVTGRVLTGAAQLGLAHATGGVSTVAIGAYRVLKPRPALPSGPGGRNPSLRPSRPAPLPGGKPRLALPPGPASNPTVVKRPRGPIALPAGNSTPARSVKRPGPAPLAPTVGGKPVTVARPVIPPPERTQGAAGPPVRRRTPPPVIKPPAPGVVVRRPLAWRRGNR